MRIFGAVLCLICLSISAQSGFAQSGAISTYAGSGLLKDGSLATTQDVFFPSAVASDGSGGFYVVAGTVRSQVYHVNSGGLISVAAGSGTQGFSGDGGPATAASLHNPQGIAVDGAGNLYIADADNGRIRKVTPGGVISTIAGNGSFGVFSGDGGPATAAALSEPYGVAVDTSGNLYIADLLNQRVRKVTSAGVISTVAGSGPIFPSMGGFSGDGGPATSARLFNPSDVALDASGNLYIADTNNARVRKVSGGIINTVAGNGTFGYSGDGGAATAASLNPNLGIAVDAGGNLYIADAGNNRIRKVTAGVISTIAGNGTFGFSGDGGPATAALLDIPNDVAVDASGNLLIADTDNNRVRKISSGIISTVAGNGSPEFDGDGGPASLAHLDGTSGAALDAAGNLYIADNNNHRIRKISSGGVISTVAGNGSEGFGGDGGAATSASLSFPQTVALDTAGNLYIADSGNSRVRKVTPGGMINTVAGNGTSGFSGDGGAATSASLDYPIGLALDGAGNLFILDSSRIRKVTPEGIISTFAGNGTQGFSGDGGSANAALLNNPQGIAVDVAGNLYIADSDNQRIRKVTPGGVISTIAGNGTFGFGGDGGPATAALLFDPRGVAFDAAGDFYIADDGNDRVRKVSDGIITTVAGNGGYGMSGDGGFAVLATLASPVAVVVNSAGSLFIVDVDNSNIRKVDVGTVVLSSSSSVLRGDFDGDGKSDILWQNADGSAAIWLMNGFSATSGGGLLGPGTGWSVKQIGDFNGDGKSDILWQNADESTAIWLMNGLGASSGGGLRGAGTGWSVKGIADFNGDGKSDIVWQHADGSSAIWLMNGLSMIGSGGLLGPGTGWSVKQTGDFNGDGKSDILWQHADGSTAIWLLNGVSVIGGGTLLGPGTGWSVKHVGDFNGDGKSDVVWQNLDGSSAIWLMDGASGISGGGLVGPGTGWSVKQVGDFNGDGKSDVAWQNSDGSAAIWLINGVGVISGAGLIGPGSGWSVKQTGDFNGDGKSDVVWQNADGSVAIWLIDGVSVISGGGLIGPATGWSPAP